MNDIQSPTTHSKLAAGLKAALLVSVVGFVVIFVERSHVTPERVGAAPAAAYVSGAYVDARPASVPVRYPDPSADAVADDDGHPPSF